MSDKPLIVYVTRSGNTKALGEMTQDKVGGDMVELEPLEPYSSIFIRHQEQVKQQNQRNHYPPVMPVDVDDYDTIYVGSPT